MLDRLHPIARHAIILCVASPVVASLLLMASAVLSASGVTGVAWGATGTAMLNAAGMSEATGVVMMVGLYFTPLTRRYGVGAAAPDLAAVPVDISPLP